MKVLHDSCLPEASPYYGEKNKAKIFRRIYPAAHVGKNQTGEERNLKTPHKQDNISLLLEQEDP